MIRAALLLAALAGPAAADPFGDAVAAWVAADDQTAFPALAAMAAAGDTRAMLFLGAVEQRPWVTDWIAALDRKARNALLRQPGGLSGKSWLFAIPEGDAMAPYAAAFGRAKEADPGPFLLLGQTWAAIPTLGAASNQQPGHVALIGAEVAYPPPAQPLVWHGAVTGLYRSLNPDPDNARIWTAQLATLADLPDDSYPRLLALHLAREAPAFADAPATDRAVASVIARGLPPETTHPAEVITRATAILMAAPETAAHRALCAPCPDVAACTLDLWALTGGWQSVFVSQTPLDLHVSPEVFAASLRQQAEILYAARNAPAGGTMDACAMEMIVP